MEEQIIINLQSASNKFLDIFFNAQSYLASWICAVVIFLFVILFISKKVGFSFGIGFLCTIGFNYLLKTIINRPRPYEANSLIINKLQTIGKSFPSGHMVSATFIVLFLWFIIKFLSGKKKIFNKTWFKVIFWIFGAVFIAFTAFARMYLGQHYITDIIAGTFVGIIGFFVTNFVYRKFLIKK